jgi:enoyl-CoA hydratase
MTAPTFSWSHTSVEGRVALVTLKATSSGKANRMGPAFWKELPSLFSWLASNDEVRAVVLRGEGEHFSSGLDLASMEELAPLLMGQPGARDRTRLYELILDMQKATTSVAECRKPVIAAVSGACIGAGVDLITACDLSLASASAFFSVREVKLAIVADMGTLARLPGIVGQGVARELALTGKDLDAARALRVGLVNDVFETQAQLFAAALKLAQELAANPPLVVQGIKQVLNLASEKAAAESLRTVAIWNAAFLPSEDLGEAVGSFLEKRPPDFKGS